jgi:two-component system chemotaxis response regulator CheY
MDSTINIVVIEDYPLMRRVTKNCLLELGFTNIFEADDGSSGLEIINNTKIDLIISDWDMPNTSGLELFRVIRANDEYKEIPFLLLAKDTQIDEIKSIADIDMDACIIKPFTADTLGRKIEYILSR